MKYFFQRPVSSTIYRYKSDDFVPQKQRKSKPKIPGTVILYGVCQEFLVSAVLDTRLKIKLSTMRNSKICPQSQVSGTHIGNYADNMVAYRIQLLDQHVQCGDTHCLVKVKIYWLLPRLPQSLSHCDLDIVPCLLYSSLR